MSKPEDQRALAMRAIMRQIQAEQPKAYVAGPARGGTSAKVQHEGSADIVLPPSPGSPTGVFFYDHPPIAP